MVWYDANVKESYKAARKKFGSINSDGIVFFFLETGNKFHGSKLKRF